MLFCNIPEKQLNPIWVCDDSTALPTTLSPGLKFMLQSPNANKQRGVFTFILADLWNLRAGVGRWFSRLIISPPVLPCPWHWILFGKGEDEDITGSLLASNCVAALISINIIDPLFPVGFGIFPNYNNLLHFTLKSWWSPNLWHVLKYDKRFWTQSRFFWSWSLWVSLNKVLKRNTF